MTKGGYMITKKNGRVSNVFGSAEKRREFARENRLEHRSEFRKPDGLRYLQDEPDIERAAAE